jgi:hypothetical protein
MMVVYTFECEWDIGCNENIYASKQRLKLDVAEALHACGIEESLEECEDAGYLTIESVEVID